MIWYRAALPQSPAIPTAARWQIKSRPSSELFLLVPARRDLSPFQASYQRRREDFAILFSSLLRLCSELCVFLCWLRDRLWSAHRMQMFRWGFRSLCRSRTAGSSVYSFYRFLAVASPGAHLSHNPAEVPPKVQFLFGFLLMFLYGCSWFPFFLSNLIV